MASQQKWSLEEGGCLWEINEDKKTANCFYLEKGIATAAHCQLGYKTFSICLSMVKRALLSDEANNWFWLSVKRDNELNGPKCLKKEKL